jgi:hypothetical protein
MKPPVLTVDDARDPAAEQVIAEGLRRYNREQCGISDGRALNVVARDPEYETRMTIRGRTNGWIGRMTESRAAT